MKYFNLLIIALSMILMGCADVKSTGETETTDPVTTPTDPVTVALMTTFDTGTATSFSSTPNGAVSASVFREISGSVVGVDCIDVNAVDSGINDPAVTDAEACIYEHEAYADLYAYLSWSPVDPVDASISFAAESTIRHSIKDPAGKLHDLDRTPSRPSGFSNSKMARIIGNTALYLSGGDLISKDLSTDIETVKYAGGINRYHTLDKSVGKLFFTVGDETRLYKPDGSHTRLIDLEGKNPIPNTNGIMYTDSIGGFGTNAAVYLKIDEDGDTSGPFRSNPVEWAAWLPLGEGPAPIATPGIGVSGVYGARFIFNAGRLYEKVSTEEDFNQVNLAPYSAYVKTDGYENISFCESGGMAYVYGEIPPEYDQWLYPDGWFKLSRIDIDTVTGFVLLDQSHAVLSLGCSENDHTVLVCGVNRSSGLSETIRITGADTDTPVKTFTDGCAGITQAP